MTINIKLPHNRIAALTPAAKWYGVFYDAEQETYYAEHVICWAIVTHDNDEAPDSIVGVFIPRDAEVSELYPVEPAGFYQYVHEENVDDVLAELNDQLAKEASAAESDGLDE